MKTSADKAIDVPWRFGGLRSVHKLELYYLWVYFTLQR